MILSTIKRSLARHRPVLPISLHQDLRRDLLKGLYTNTFILRRLRRDQIQHFLVQDSTRDLQVNHMEPRHFIVDSLLDIIQMDSMRLQLPILVEKVTGQELAGCAAIHHLKEFRV